MFARQDGPSIWCTSKSKTYIYFPMVLDRYKKITLVEYEDANILKVHAPSMSDLLTVWIQSGGNAAG
eukprot:12731238-Ditylum_brightwellii.AAC.1